ncbi:MAG: hypothetical protein LBP72_01105 [Dysgonamonadaceae bacterium]|jgi:hypothetical protein|nr:hypothetical protein [Dysgonamonadaceae bacterium]
MFPNLVGIVNSLLLTISALAGQNDPQYKITPVGFLQMLLENATTATVANADDLRKGLERTLTVRYMQRGTDTDVVDTDDCETNVTAAWKQTNIGAPMFSKLGIKIEDDLLRQLQESATSTITLGSQGANVYLALYQTVLTQLNGLIQKIDKNLLAAQAGNWGVNIASGSSAARAVNFSNTPNISDGIVKLISDYQFNEMSGTPQIVGNGIITNYDILQRLKIGVDNGGFGSNPVNVYTDVNTVSAWGANHFGVFVPGLVDFVDYQRNIGAFAGFKGGSLFFTMPVPVQLAGGRLVSLVFDCQLKYNDCPDGDSGRGWFLLISKRYGLWNAPADMFKQTIPAVAGDNPVPEIPGDRLEGFNGSLHYLATAV